MNAPLLRRLAHDVTQDYRHLAHRAFDQIWRRGSRVDPWMTRRDAYRWLATFLGVPWGEAHFATLSAAACLRVIAEVERLIAARPDLRRRKRRQWDGVAAAARKGCAKRWRPRKGGVSRHRSRGQRRRSAK